jgi:hypothetical protein
VGDRVGLVDEIYGLDVCLRTAVGTGDFDLGRWEKIMRQRGIWGLLDGL